jgi:Tol biopolymer transport system component
MGPKRAALLLAFTVGLAACTNTPRAVRPSPSAAPSSSPTPLPEPTVVPAPTNTSVPALAGRVVFSSNDDIYSMDADGSNLRQLTHRRGPEFDPAWSPDGKRIVYRDSRRGINRNDEIYVMRADGSNQRNISRDPADDWGPAWSPDGKWIAFSAAREGMPQIFVMRPDGSDAHRLNELEGEYPAWSPDGSRIAFMSQEPGARGNDPNYNVYVMNADGSRLTRLTDYPGEDGWLDWSPDGTKIVFTTSHDDQGQSGDIGPYWDLYVMNADGSAKTRITRLFAGFPSWSPDGRFIMFAGSGLPLSSSRLYVATTDGSKVAVVPMGRDLGDVQFPDWIGG